MKKIIYLSALICLLFLISCENEHEDEKLSPPSESVEFKGYWQVNAFVDSTFIFGPFSIITLENTNNENDSIIIYDGATKFWNFRAKASADKKNGLFETKLSICRTSGESVGIKISNGIISQNDSIYFNIQFEDDATPFGTTYELKGHRIEKDTIVSQL